MINTISVCVTGPESCGKTTLSTSLSESLKFKLIPEYSREYLSRLSEPYNSSDLVNIARGQLQQFASQSSFITDTGVEVVKIWHEEKFGKSETISDLWKEQSFDIYLLCSPDIPWEYDELRENPFDRHRLFDLYEDLLESSGRRYSIIQGADFSERLIQATSIIREIKNP